MRHTPTIRKPNMFIVGAGRAGTTALHYFLSQHPDIFMSEPKELMFFYKDLIKEGSNFLKNKPLYLKQDLYPVKTEEEYLNVFSGWRSEKIAGEATPGYLYSKVAAKEIHKFNPTAKIIIILRNPVDIIYSRYSHALQRGVENVKDFSEALALEKEREKGKHLPKYSLFPRPSNLFYMGRAQFSKQVKRYLDLFDRKQVKIIIYDDFKKDNARVYREVLDFLGVDLNFTPNFDLVNVNKVAKFPKVKILFKSSLFTKISEIPQIFLPKPMYPKYVNFRNAIFRLLFVKEQPRSPMDPKLREELMRKFKPEVKRLSKLVGRDLVSLWGYAYV